MSSVHGAGFGKYGNGRGHDPRCNCPDCNAKFLEHNRAQFCGCIDCTYQREIGAAQPPMVPKVSAADWHYQPQEFKVPNTNERITYPKEEKRMAGIHMCEREGCNSFIRGDALAYVDLMPNTVPGTERTVKELCPACVADVYNLLHTEPLDDRAKAYDKPYKPGEADKDDVDAATDEQLLAELLTRLAKRGQKELTGTVVEDD